MDIKTIIKEENKLNIVFDLDLTCVFCSAINPKDYVKIEKKFKNKNIKCLCLSIKKENKNEKGKKNENKSENKNEKENKNENKKMLNYLIIRKKLNNFIDFAKDFCNFHISTLGVKSYGNAVKEILEEEYGCKFNKFQAKDKKNDNKKFLKHLDLDKKNTLIFDDNPHFWIEDFYNVIISKKFVDQEIIDFISNKKGLQPNIYLLEIYFPFCYYQSEKNKYNQIYWRKQKLYHGRQSPFYYFKKDDTKNNICYNGEYLYSSKYQFTYMKDVIKIVYYLVFNYHIYVPDALKLIRYNIFHKTYFNLNFYKNNSNGIEILKDVIENCGGQIIESYENNSLVNEKILIVCRKDDYSKLKDKIKKELSIFKNSIVVSDKYILDSFYFMTNLENELNDPEYSFQDNNNNNNNDDNKINNNDFWGF